MDTISNSASEERWPELGSENENWPGGGRQVVEGRKNSKVRAVEAKSVA